MFHGLDNASYYRLADNVREFWHGDDGKVKDLIERLVGSAPYFDHDGRTTTSSLNFLTGQDGFILQDKVSYSRKHNLATGKRNAMGIPTINPATWALKDRPTILRSTLRARDANGT